MNVRCFSILGLLIFSSGSLFAQKAAVQEVPESVRAAITELWEPQPRIITPGAKPGDAPSDAIILFDGKNFDQWTGRGDSVPKWTLKDGAMTVLPDSKEIKTKRKFQDFQLHVEWRTPLVVDTSKTSQGRGNSGIFLQGLYEVQVLDNYKNKTYANGQASAIYKQHIPLVNACRKPGEWQTYDIVFTAPRFNADGRVIVPAYVTVIHNGVITQNHVAVLGPTSHLGMPVYKPVEKGPIELQDHGNTVSYRNIWIREM